jgi:parallel beta-helix repeat protein
VIWPQAPRQNGQALPGGSVYAVCVLLLVGVLAAGLVPAVVGAAEGVSVFPGHSIQAAVNANPEGTTFIIKAGTHLGQQVIPKNGDSFIGEPGAILDGQHTATYAFGMGGKEVTVRGLVIENYAAPLQKGAIQPGNESWRWLLENNEIRLNSGGGIGAGSGWVVRGNYVHHNGQIGVFGAGDDILFEGNEIAFNNTDNIDSGWEAGGSKFVWTRNLILRNNYVHDNQGPGLWVDGHNIYTLYEGNRVINNSGPGINHEISYDAVIRNNLVEGNGFGWTGWVDGAGILVANSPNVNVYGNTVRYNNDGIAGIQANRGSGNYGPYQLKNLWVHNNLIVMEVGQTGIVRQDGCNDPVWSTDWNNRFDYNTYTLGTADKYYAWDPWYITTAQWQAAGQDTHSTWTTGTTTTHRIIGLIVSVIDHTLDIAWDAIRSDN